MQPERATTAPSRRSRSRRYMATGGGALAAVLAGGVIVALAADRGDREPLGFEPSPTPMPTAIPAPTAAASLSPTPSPTPAATPPPSPTPGPVEITWSMEPFPGQVAGVLEAGDGILAAGRDEQGLAVWMSTSGSEWSRHRVPNPTDDSGWISLGPIVPLGGTVFSFGTSRGIGDYHRPVAWRSTDGRPWEYIESDSPFFRFGSVVHLIAGDGALLAVTDAGLVGPVQNLWRWTAQSSWETTDLESTAEGTIAINGLVWDGMRYIAIGATHQGHGPQDEWLPKASGWTSTDGLAWDPMSLPEDISVPCALVSTPNGDVLLLGRTPQGPTAWSSTADGTWSEPAPVAAGWRDGCWKHVSALDRGFITAMNGSDELIVSVSGDGRSWHHTTFPGLTASANRIAVVGDQVMIFATRPPTAEDPEQTFLLRGAVGG
jgi:hypothetical protein